MAKNPKLENVYKIKTVESQRQLYREWAKTYEADAVEEFGWIGFETAAAEFAKRVCNKSARILDAGCGTGLSGVALLRKGYDNIHGLDLSSEMLQQAGLTGAYKTLAEADLTRKIVVDEPFDAVFSSGLFGFGPPHPKHLGILVDALKRGGIAIVTVNGRGWDECNWQEKLAVAVKEQNLNLEERFEIPYLEVENIRGIMLVFRA